MFSIFHLRIPWTSQSHKKALEYFKAAAEKGDATAWKTPPALP